MAQVKEFGVNFVRLQFTDIFGCLKNVALTIEQLPRALKGRVMFDGSSIHGLPGVEESDMYLIPDPDTFVIFPWRPHDGSVARLICDIHDPQGRPAAGCSRTRLKRVLQEAKESGYTINMGPEAEFFLFHTDERGEPTLKTHDHGGYFDLSPLDRGEDARRDIVLTLRKMGIEVESSHHEMASGQHEIVFHYQDALTIADQFVTSRYVTRSIAQRHGLHATFMPKPLPEANGSGMHCNQSLFKGGENVFYSPETPGGISQIACHYLAGLLQHAPALTAITNPTINSYKRLSEGYNAPVYIAWSSGNRSALIRIPSERGPYTRVELRSPDGTCNPYLAQAAIIASGLQGIKEKLKPPAEVKGNLYQLEAEERQQLGIKRLPYSLPEALKHLENDPLLQGVLGQQIYSTLLKIKYREWQGYQDHVHSWEHQEYLKKF